MKTLIKIFICLSLIYTPFFAFASAAEKWTIEEISYDNVAKNIKIQAEKNYGPSANDNKYKVKVPVTASAAGSTALSMFRYGLASAALYGLVEGVGWIIDNGVVKKLDEDSIDPDDAILQYAWEVGPRINIQTCNVLKRYDFLSAAVAEYDRCLYLYNPIANYEKLNCSYDSPTAYSCYFKNNRNGATEKHTLYQKPNPNYNPEVQPEYVPVSNTELGNEIINSPAAPQIIPDIYNPNNPVARPSPAPDAVDKALENAPPIPKDIPKSDTTQKPNKDTDGDGQPDEYDPALPSVGQETEWPEACSWFPTICEWYTKYKEDSDLAKEHRESEQQVWIQEEIARQEEKQQREDEKSFWQKVEDWFDWSKEDSELPENEQPEIIDLPVPELKEDAIKWNSQCPADVQIPINLQGVSSTITFSWSPWCQLLDVIKPAIIASAYIGAAFIVLGLRT